MHLENKYFSWEDWDGDMWDSLTFTNCTLQRDMGNFKKGDHIKVISMSYQEGWIEFYDEDSVIATFNFLYTHKLLKQHLTCIVSSFSYSDHT